MNRLTAHSRAVLQALFVCFLWSTSWILIKFGLLSLPPLVFAGLRYFLAFLILLPFFLRSGGVAALNGLSNPDRWLVAALGILIYAFTQGAQFMALQDLPAVTVNLLLNFTTILVAAAGIFFLNEQPTWQQWLGMGIAICGALVYFSPIALPAGQVVGLAAALVGLAANAASSILGRSVNRRRILSPLHLTTASMGVGSVLLLSGGIAFQGWPVLDFPALAVIAWLASVNTAFAFTLWNLTLRSLNAMESSLINSSMLIQIPILAILFMGETLNLRQLTGLVLAAAGIITVQFGRQAQSARN